MCCPGHQLIADGWSVLPLCWTDEAGDCACRRQHGPKSAGKVPLTRHGVNDATTDLAQVDFGPPGGLTPTGASPVPV